MDFPQQPADLYEYGRIACRQGFRRMVGIDEAGRGPLAGPVAAAAVYLPPDLRFDGLDDSKRLTPKQRERLYAEILAAPGVASAVVMLGAREIERLNILRATWEAMRQAAVGIQPPPDLILVDGKPVAGLPCRAHAIVKGDGKCAAIAAASVLAKVTRDRHMQDADAEYPGYGFARHKGYPTRAHFEALVRLGPCPIHRRTFRPVAALLTPGSVPDELPLQ